MNALEIVQRVFREAGGPGQDPVSIIGNTGFASECVDWTNTAWRWTQALRQDWWWLWTESTKTLTVDQSQYDLSADFSITDARYIKLDDVVVWDPAKGISDQTGFTIRDPNDWRSRWDFKDPNAGKPYDIAHLEDGKLAFGPKPDMAYSARIRYYQKTGEFTSDTDIPGIPVEYHDIIVYRALMLWSGREENVTKYRHFENEVDRWQNLLQADARIQTSFGNGCGTLK